jgi:hypothetical protein
MRSFRRALGLLAASAPLAFAVACADPELKSDLVTEGPPEVTEVNVLSESVVLADATFLRLGEGATFCRPGTEYKVNQVYCPLERDSSLKPIPGAREVAGPVVDVQPYAAAVGMEDFTSQGLLPNWHIRFIFDELLDGDVEDVIDVGDGVMYGTLAETQPVTVSCNDVDLTYDGFYDPSGNHLSYPPGPALVVQVTDFVATGSSCQASIKDGAVTDEDGEAVPGDQTGPYDFQIAPLTVYSTDPADASEGVDPAATFFIELNAPIDLATVASAITFEEMGGAAVAFTVQYAAVDPADPAAGTIDNIVELVPNALDPMTTYVVTIDSGIADVAGGALTLDAPIPTTFTTGEAAP